MLREGEIFITRPVTALFVYIKCFCSFCACLKMLDKFLESILIMM